MKEAINVLKVAKQFTILVEVRDECQKAIQILQAHNKEQQPQIPKKLDSEGVNGLINALHSLRLAGVTEIEIENHDDHVVIKRLKR